MSDNKKYYYLKLKEDFFNSDAMVVLESMPDGYKYSNILLKLYLRSLKQDGKLMFNERIPYNSNILASVTRHSVGDVEKAIKIFKELELIEILDNGAIYMLDIQNFIGKSSTEADRIRSYREKIKQEKAEIGQSSTKGVQMYDICNDKSTPEIEIEKNIELDKENIYSQADQPDDTPDNPDDASSTRREIVEYLNRKAGTNYRWNSDKAKRHIDARLNEGYKLDDFKAVVDVKVSQWLGNKDMQQYLRPETLFGTKFEGYLNESILNKPKRYAIDSLPDEMTDEVREQHRRFLEEG